MACLKDTQHYSSRPLGQHRLSISSTTGNSFPKVHNRIYSHPNTTSSLLSTHRVTRRKSVSTNNNAVMVAAVREVAAVNSTQGIPIVGRRVTASRTITTSPSAKSSIMESLSSPPLSLATHRAHSKYVGKLDRDESAIDDDQMDDASHVDGDGDDEGEDEGETSKSVPSRIVGEDQSHLLKDEKKSNPSDLKCEKCGKEYKHSSCLTKHLWEHTPEWSYTSKLLISKHQQVQLLEAASVLLTMNQDIGTAKPVTASPFSTREYQSDHDSASVSSEQHDCPSSADTTPPPQTEIFNTFSSSSRHSFTSRYKRHSCGNGQDLSLSYQPISSNNSWLGHDNLSEPSVFGDHSALNKKGHFKDFSSGIGRDHEDEALASAVQLLSCSFGSNGTPLPPNQFTYSEDNLLLPDIPALYLNQSDFITSVFSSSHHPRQNESYTRARIHDREDIKMKTPASPINDDEDYQRSPYRSDEDEDGVFGRMEE